MEEIFGIAAFRSRQQVLRFEGVLKRAGVPASIITTPRSVSVGCGLSVRFDMADFSDVEGVWAMEKPGTFIGFYQVRRRADGRTAVTPIKRGR